MKSASKPGRVNPTRDPRFAVRAEYLSRFQVQTVGGAIHTEYWVTQARPGSFALQGRLRRSKRLLPF